VTAERDQAVELWDTYDAIAADTETIQKLLRAAAQRIEKARTLAARVAGSMPMQSIHAAALRVAAERKGGEAAAAVQAMMGAARQVCSLASRQRDELAAAVAQSGGDAARLDPGHVLVYAVRDDRVVIASERPGAGSPAWSITLDKDGEAGQMRMVVSSLRALRQVAALVADLGELTRRERADLGDVAEVCVRHGARNRRDLPER